MDARRRRNTPYGNCVAAALGKQSDGLIKNSSLFYLPGHLKLPPYNKSEYAGSPLRE